MAKDKKRSKNKTITGAREALEGSTGMLASPEVAAVAARFHEVRDQGTRTFVAMAAELGEILLEGKRLLRGHYRRWLGTLDIEWKTASNYVALARFAAESPALLERHQLLGVGKLYRIAKLAPAARHEVLRHPDLKAMQPAEFAAFILPYVTRQRKVSGNMRAHGLRLKMQSSRRTYEKARIPKTMDTQMRQALRSDAEELIKVLLDFVARVGG